MDDKKIAEIMGWSERGMMARELPDDLPYRVRMIAKVAAEMEREACAKDAARYRWLANNCDGDAQDDFMRWLAGTVAPKEIIDTQIDEAMERSNEPAKGRAESASSD